MQDTNVNCLNVVVGSRKNSEGFDNGKIDLEHIELRNNSKKGKLKWGTQVERHHEKSITF